MKEESFSEFELNTTIDVLERISMFCNQTDKGKFTAGIIDLATETVKKIIKTGRQT